MDVRVLGVILDSNGTRNLELREALGKFKEPPQSDWPHPGLGQIPEPAGDATQAGEADPGLPPPAVEPEPESDLESDVFLENHVTLFYFVPADRRGRL